MNLTDKYSQALSKFDETNVSKDYVKTEGAQLKLRGKVETLRQKDLIWDSIKKAGGESPSDIEADIRVENSEYYAKHTVESGESLSKIANMYYGKPAEYTRIFEANRDILDDPNMIHPDQKLTIPFPEGRNATS